ncbi:sigma-70 family RNA polymerase sigma factor [Pelagicoccus sp. SDUM812003]|uniref:RNA polymerase sigma factor n=1 Tax=Pelagicoccus sp. SDUM812003 TaxID=3041267 RepID=UPI00280DB4F2|nr:sigma-70 family RNA polymerase sigma factor [Pelagicoccus sp. SDUM812003]MDQ8204042.1 sigma-70 family RNA polymerase sigma factor [Pelagicoccus sp. SDUM812003]
MNLNTNSPSFEDIGDATLVTASLQGDRQAFGKIVTRYQRLLCSVAYSSLGDLARSEDLAQETFIEAWKKLAGLKEPEKLKSWLCGILRFKLSHHRRKEARQPLARAEELEHASELESDSQGAEEYTMKEEEQALLWQSLEKVPETYREALILYYREHRSVEHVAYELDLSEDAVKQRLSRGRKLLQERMMTFVEDALARSTPGRVFTAGVLAALPAMMAPPAKAVGTGAVAAQIGSALKWTGVATFLASISGVISSGFALRAGLDQSRTDLERRKVIRTVISYFALAILFVAGILGMRQLVIHGYWNSGYAMWLAQALAICFAASYLYLTVRMFSSSRALRIAERLRRPDLFQSEIDQIGSKKREYRSRATLFGVPLLHVQFTNSEGNEGPAIGWIAAGEKAYGLLFAWGGYAVGTISVGIVSVGLISLGAVGFGVIGVGTVGVGLLALGASAIGYKAYASLSALGWESAFSNGFSAAKEGAIGPIAMAKQVNNEQAGQIVNLASIEQSHVFVMLAMSALVIVPVVLYAKAVRKRMGKGKRES